MSDNETQHGPDREVTGDLRMGRLGKGKGTEAKTLVADWPASGRVIEVSDPPGYISLAAHLGAQPIRFGVAGSDLGPLYVDPFAYADYGPYGHTADAAESASAVGES